MTSLDPVRHGDRVAGRPFATRSAVCATRGMVCASQPLAARIGLRVLEDGGSAVDAALATNAALGLMEPTSCGVGGDLFVLLWDAAAARLVGFNGSGRSPRGLDLAGLCARLSAEGRTRLPPLSALSVSVPGCVDGWMELHARYGRLPFARLLEPSIAAAEEGFPLSEVIAHEWSRSAALGRLPGFARTFLPEGQAPREGELFRNPDLARTYRLVAERGRDGFYRGEVAEALAACVAEYGGALVLDDLVSHRGEWVQPLSVSYRGHELWELPPNGQGLAALQMLKLIEGWDVSRGDALTVHRLLEAKKLAYEDRARFYTDPEFADAPIGMLLSDEYAARRRELVDDARASRAPSAGDALLERGDTVYLTTADSDGNLVSWIQSNYMGFGTGLVPEGRGFSLQNRGALFTLDPSHANVYAPGKRPFHTIIPAMLTRAGRPVLSFGVMGGAMQPQGHVQIVTNMLDRGMGVQEAGDAPRWRHEGSSQPTGERMTDGGVVHLESGVPAEVARGLAERGHEVVVGPGGYGGYQAIAVDDSQATRVYRGASESRKDGCAMGF